MHQRQLITNVNHKLETVAVVEKKVETYWILTESCKQGYEQVSHVACKCHMPNMIDIRL